MGLDQYRAVRRIQASLSAIYRALDDGNDIQVASACKEAAGELLAFADAVQGTSEQEIAAWSAAAQRAVDRANS